LGGPSPARRTGVGRSCLHLRKKGGEDSWEGAEGETPRVIGLPSRQSDGWKSLEGGTCVFGVSDSTEPLGGGRNSGLYFN